MWIDVLITGTHLSHGTNPWQNLFDQRIHEDAQPEVQLLARKMKDALKKSTPAENNAHYPYLTPGMYPDSLAAISTARCARVSYKPFDAAGEDILKDLFLADKLECAGHWSPFEHVATAAPGEQHGVLFGWKSERAKKER